MNIKEITQGIIDNYEVLIDTKKSQIQDLVNRNNDRIISAIRSIRNEEEKEG